MGLVLAGINHKTAPLKVRERISFTKKRLKEAFVMLNQMDSICAGVILSTCNRTEIYACLTEDKEKRPGGKEQIIRFFLSNYQFAEDEIRRYFYVLEDADAIRHIFRVASGLDSQVLGETQILGQVKSVRKMLKDSGIVNGLLDELFEKAVDVGRVVRRETKISRGNISIGSVAMRMLEEKLKDLSDKLILIIGAGKIGALVSKYFRKRGIRGIFVSNRTYARAYELSLNCGGEAISFSQLKEKLKEVDIIISSTASPHFVLRKELLAEVMQIRVKPLLIMDLALPRDVDPEAKKISGISLYNLDDLKSVIEENFVRREKEAKLAEVIVQREVNKFLNIKWKILCRQEKFLESVSEAVL